MRIEADHFAHGTRCPSDTLREFSAYSSITASPIGKIDTSIRLGSHLLNILVFQFSCRKTRPMVQPTTDHVDAHLTPKDYTRADRGYELSLLCRQEVMAFSRRCLTNYSRVVRCSVDSMFFVCDIGFPPSALCKSNPATWRGMSETINKQISRGKSSHGACHDIKQAIRIQSVWILF